MFGAGVCCVGALGAERAPRLRKAFAARPAFGAGSGARLVPGGEVGVGGDRIGEVGQFGIAPMREGP